MNNNDILTCNRIIETVNRMKLKTLTKFAKDNKIRQSFCGNKTILIKRHLIVSHIMKSNFRVFEHFVAYEFSDLIIDKVLKLNSEHIDYYTQKEQSGRWNPLIQDMDLMNYWNDLMA